MSRLLVGTDGPEASEALADYLEWVLAEDDVVYLMNSLVGGEETSGDEIADGEAALDVLEESLPAAAIDDRQQFVRGNQPIEDFLAVAEDWDADEYVIGIRKRTPVGKVVFGSTAQNLLLETERPLRTVPLISD